jgi:hypothetical protein
MADLLIIFVLRWEIAASNSRSLLAQDRLSLPLNLLRRVTHKRDQSGWR